VVLKAGKQLVEQMFSGTDPISPRGQIFGRDWPAQFDVETPAAFVQDGTGDQFRPVMQGQPHRAGGHLKSPAPVNRHVHLFAGRKVNRHQQRISRGQKLVRGSQLVLVEGGRNFRKGRKPVTAPPQPGTEFGFPPDQRGNRNARRPQPESQQRKGAEMAKGQHDRASTLPGLPQTIKPSNATAVHPFGFRQPLREKFQQNI